METRAVVLRLLQMLMILLSAAWVTLWVLKPTTFWTKTWKAAEDRWRLLLLGYYGLHFLFYTFPVVAVCSVGLVYLNLLPKLSATTREGGSWVMGFRNPAIISSFVGILSCFEILGVILFILFLTWTFYARISNDFKKLIPVKSLSFTLWQLKYIRVATRFGLLAEACLALLLLPVLRGLALFQLIGIQFEASVRYHIWLGTSMVLFATLHGVSTLFIWGVSHHVQEEIWRWQETGRVYLAGEIALVVALVMWITSLPQIRRKRFEIFYYTHHLYIVFFIFFLFHAGDRHFYTIFAGVFLFALDKLLRVVQSRPQTYIHSACLFPSRAIELILPKDPSLEYSPTSIVYIKIPSISRLHWHCFSLTSSSRVNTHTMSVIIKCEGEWTSSLYTLVQGQLDSEADQMNPIPIMIEGPYGPAFPEFLRYDRLILIAGGIGITPFLSILKEVASSKFPTQVELVFVTKSARDMSLLSSISSLLFQPSSSRRLMNLKLKAFVTRESKGGNVMVKALVNDCHMVRRVNFSSNERSSKLLHAAQGLESRVWMAAVLAFASKLFILLLICFNHAFATTPGKKNEMKKMTVVEIEDDHNKATPSTIIDMILLSCLAIMLTLSCFVGVIVRWRRVKQRETAGFYDSNLDAKEKQGAIEEGREEHHEVHFGRRPNLEEVVRRWAKEGGTSEEIGGVIVCGPESMKASVASVCAVNAQGFKATENKPYLCFHSLSFTL
ncbi:Ferric reduction oxidase 8, mitochondrial [Linum perenne]